MTQETHASGWRKLAAVAVHCYTASGLLWATLIAFSIFDGRYATAGLWMMVAFFVDSSDGALARLVGVKEVLPFIDGRRLDDIVDYLNYTFLPLLLLGHAGWVPSPVVLWLGVPMVASVFAFCNTNAKEEGDGFFLGFPSYWNIYAIYVVLWLHSSGTGPVLFYLLLFSVLSVAPVRFVYPSHAAQFRLFFIGGGILWFGLIVYLLWSHPEGQVDLVYSSMAYPILYVVLSFYLDFKRRKGR